MNIPKNVLVATAEQSAAFREFLINYYIENTPNDCVATASADRYSLWKDSFKARAKGDKVGAIREVRGPWSDKRQWFVEWAGSYNLYLPETGIPSLVDAKNFVDAILNETH